MHKLHIKDITKTIKKTQILHGISLEVNSGEIVGLLGPNGAGKTTTFYTVCGLVKPTSGNVFFDDKDIDSGNNPIPGNLQRIDDGQSTPFYTKSNYDNSVQPFFIMKMVKKYTHFGIITKVQLVV